jgi:hypothetical protein
MPTRLTLRTELLAMREEDLRLRQELLQARNLEGGYHRDMEDIHKKNASRLREIIAQYGWPTRTLVGVDGEEAAWLIVQHAIGEPELLRASVSLLEEAVAAGEAPAWQLAYLSDRIAFSKDARNATAPTSIGTTRVTTPFTGSTTYSVWMTGGNSLDLGH